LVNGFVNNAMQTLLELDDTTFENAYNTGRGITVEQAIALALED